MDEEGKESGSYSLVPVVVALPGLELASLSDDWIEPEYVVGYRAQRRGRWRRWWRLLLGLSEAVIIAALLWVLPDFRVDALHTWKDPSAVFILVCLFGKALVDTLFYDHYRP